MGVKAHAYTYTPPPPQTYLLKLARSGEEGEKVLLVLESGVRFHTTQVRACACLWQPARVNYSHVCSIALTVPAPPHVHRPTDATGEG